MVEEPAPRNGDVISAEPHPLPRGSPGSFGYAVAFVAAWGIVANLGRIGSSAQAFDEPYYAEAAWRYIHGDNNPAPTGVFSNYDNLEHPPFAKYLFGIA